MRKSGRTKQRLLEKAIETVAEKGYSASSTREIAARAGVSEATLFKYYQSKDELLKQIVIKTIDDFYDYSINQALPPIMADQENRSARGLLQELLTERLDFFRQNLPAIQVILQEMMINNTVRELFYKKVWSRMEQISTQIFSQGKSGGEIREIDNYFLKKALFGMLFYTITFEPIFAQQPPGDYDNKTQAEEIVNLLFNGIQANQKEGE